MSRKHKLLQLTSDSTESNSTGTNATATVSYTYSICINCNSTLKKEKKLNSSLNAVKELLSGENVNATVSWLS